MIDFQLVVQHRAAGVLTSTNFNLDALGYGLPKSLTKRLRMQSFRMYVSGTNLWTSQEYSGYNPEIFNGSVFDNGIDRGNIYPIAKTVTVGLDIQF